MKKVLIIIICLFSFIEIGFASNKYNSKLYVKENNKETSNIVIKDKKEFSIDLYFTAKDFDLYGIIFELDYDKDSLELKEVKEANNFEITSGSSILADRIEIPKNDNHKVLTLTFKVKSEKDSKILLKKIAVADIKEQFELEDVSITISKNTKTLYYLGAGLLVVVVAVIEILRRKKKNN